MKRNKLLAAVAITLSLIASGCGTSDYVQSISITQPSSTTTGGVYNLVGWGGTLQLQVNANYHSGKTIPVTASATYTVTPQGTDYAGIALEAPPNTVTMSPTGMMTAVNPTVCTWKNEDPSGTASWALSGGYQVVATYKGMASQPVFVGVASAAGSLQQTVPGECGPASS